MSGPPLGASTSHAAGRNGVKRRVRAFLFLRSTSCSPEAPVPVRGEGMESHTPPNRVIDSGAPVRICDVVVGLTLGSLATAKS